MTSSPEQKSAVQRRLEESASKKPSVDPKAVLGKLEDAEHRREKLLEAKVETAKKLEGTRTPPNEKEDHPDLKEQLVKKEEEATARREALLAEKKEKAKKLEGSAKKPTAEDLEKAKQEAPVIKKTDNRDDAPVAAAIKK